MTKKNSNKTKTPPPVKLTGLEFYFDKFAAAHQNPANKLIYTTFIPLLIFSLLGIMWTIPFPYIKFLGQYNQYFNWSSFLLAFMVLYYYFKFSPMLSYFVMLILFGFYYIITQLLAWQKAGGPDFGLLSLGIYFISFIALFIGYQIEGKKLSWEYRMKNILIAPIFLLHLVLKRFKIRY